MTTFRRTLWCVVPLALLAALLFAPPAATFAQEATPPPAEATTVVTLTEAQINEGRWLRTPWRLRLDDITADLQPGQAVLDVTVTPRGNRTVYALSVTLTPTIVEGRLVWDVAAASRDGQPVPEDVLAQVQTSVTTSWARFLRTEQALPGALLDVQVSGDALTLTYDRATLEQNADTRRERRQNRRGG